MNRRTALAGLLCAAAIRRAQAQQTGKVYQIAIVDPSIPVADLSEGAGLPLFRAFFEELRRLGYVEGKNLQVERYSGGGRAERYPELARDVVRRHADVIFAETNNLVRDFKAATATIPIVAITADPVGGGILASLGDRAATSRALASTRDPRYMARCSNCCEKWTRERLEWGCSLTETL
jgi:putative ABC transport system substrate-binding protein